jgi:hypothetical protein
MSLGRRKKGEMKMQSGEAAAKVEETRAAEVAKTMRLRELRLAKEAADREADIAAATQALARQSPRIRVRTRNPA